VTDEDPIAQPSDIEDDPSTAAPQRTPSRLKGKISLADDFDAVPEDIEAAFEDD
jgi:hypothetical protein